MQEVKKEDLKPSLRRALAHAVKRDRKRSPKVGLHTNSRHAGARRLEYQHQTSASALSYLRTAGQDATQAKETFKSEQRYAASSHRLERELEHGFCARSASKWSGRFGAHGNL